MRRPHRRLALFAVLPLLLFATLAQAGVQLVVRGVDEPLQQAVTASVGLSQYAHREVSEAPDLRRRRWSLTAITRRTSPRSCKRRARTGR